MHLRGSKRRQVALTPTWSTTVCMYVCVCMCVCVCILRDVCNCSESSMLQARVNGDGEDGDDDGDGDHGDHVDDA